MDEGWAWWPSSCPIGVALQVHCPLPGPPPPSSPALHGSSTCEDLGCLGPHLGRGPVRKRGTSVSFTLGIMGGSGWAVCVCLCLVRVYTGDRCVCTHLQSLASGAFQGPSHPVPAGATCVGCLQEAGDRVCVTCVCCQDREGGCSISRGLADSTDDGGPPAHARAPGHTRACPQW